MTDIGRGAGERRVEGHKPQNTSAEPRRHVFEYYRGGKGELWFWRLVAPNGKIIADGAESYKRKSNILEAIDRVKMAVPGAEIVEKK